MFLQRQKAEAKLKPNSVAPMSVSSANAKHQPAWTNALPLQPKLTVNQPGDQYEQEADRVSAQVMRMPTPTVQRCACGGVAGPDGECATCKAKRLSLQRKANGIAHTEAPPSVHQTLRSSGQPLDTSTRAFMEPRFGQDFSNVRVHTDSQSALDVSARAYTVGNNVVFGAGQYAPGTKEGKHLLAHELTHVVQQSPSQDFRPQSETQDEHTTTINAKEKSSEQVSPIRKNTNHSTIYRFETSERGQISNAAQVIATARSIADRTSFAGMRWGRFTAGAGGAGAYEAVSGSKDSQANLPNRYLFTCRCGLVDMRHFYQLMYIAIVPFQGGNRGATQSGRQHELTSEATSRFAPEDTPSNALGAFFGSQQSTMQLQSTFVQNLTAYLNRCNPIEFASLSPADQDTIVNYYGERNAAGAPSHPNETATPVTLGIAGCTGQDRSFPFVTDPAEARTITSVAAAAPVASSAAVETPDAGIRDAGEILPGGIADVPDAGAP